MLPLCCISSVILTVARNYFLPRVALDMKLSLLVFHWREVVVGQPDIRAVILLHYLVVLVATAHVGLVKVWARAIKNLLSALPRDCSHLCSLRFWVQVAIVTA